MEVHYWPGHLTCPEWPGVGANSVAFLRQEWKSSLRRETPLSPTSSTWSHQIPTAWRVPPTESRGVFHADRQSSRGSGAPLFPGRGCGVGGL